MSPGDPELEETLSVATLKRHMEVKTVCGRAEIYLAKIIKTMPKVWSETSHIKRTMAPPPGRDCTGRLKIGHNSPLHANTQLDDWRMDGRTD